MKTLGVKAIYFELKDSWTFKLKMKLLHEYV